MPKKNKDNNHVPRPLITVVTVVFNGEDCLEQTILSVVNQNYPNVEYIVIDGASTDGTLQILNKYKAKISYCLSELDNGIYEAMNKGIKVANGDYIIFLGAGDILLNVLDRLVSNFTDLSCVYYGNAYRNDLQKIYDGEFSGFKLAVVNICHQSIFYPLSALKKHLFNTRYKILADHDLNMRCYGDKDLKFKYIPLLISIYEGDGISAIRPDFEFFADKLAIIRKNFPFLVYCYACIRRTVAHITKSVKYI